MMAPQKKSDQGGTSMTIKEAIISVFTNYATFSGRARRSEYWFFALFNSIVSSALSILGRNIFGDGSSVNLFTMLASLYSLAVLLPGLAVTWRRLHDVGKSGANYFWVLLPIVGWIILIVYLCRDSQPGENQYGPNPKEPVYYNDRNY